MDRYDINYTDQIVIVCISNNKQMQIFNLFDIKRILG